jgi:hypothetical protein
MFIYDTKAQRQMIREHVDQLAQEMRRIPDPTVPSVTRSRRVRRATGITDLVHLGMRRLRWARLRAHILRPLGGITNPLRVVPRRRHMGQPPP